MTDASTSAQERGPISTPNDSDDHMQNAGADDMDIDVTPEKEETFRQNSLALVTYPWTTGIVMQSDWSKCFDREHFAFASFSTDAFYKSN